MKEKENLQQRINLINEIFTLVMKINMGDKYMCFAYLSPHIKCIDVSIRDINDYTIILKNRDYISYDNTQSSIELEVEDSHEEMIEILNQVKQILEGYCE